MATFEHLKKINIFDNHKIYILRDPAILLHEFLKKKREQVKDLKIEKKKPNHWNWQIDSTKKFSFFN